MVLTILEQEQRPLNTPKTELKPELPDALTLQDRTPEWLKARPVFFMWTALVGVFYWYLNTWPLWHTDLWGHLAYGRFIWESGHLPATEPLMPLSSGVAFVDTAWLSQLIGFAAVSTWGNPALHFLFAACITACVGLLVGRFYGRSGSIVVTLIGLTTFLWVDWQQLPIVRPQLAGLFCFVALLSLLTVRRWTAANWIVVPMLFALWANLHGSFPVGLAMLGAFCVGRACDVVWRTRRLTAVLHDRRVRRWFLLTELAAVAVLANPYGLGLYAEVFTLSSNANLSDLVEWEPLTLRMRQGRAAAAAALMLIVIYRMSPRRVSMTELLLLVGLGAGALWASRMIVWWAPVSAWFLVLHAGAALKHMTRKPAADKSVRRGGTWTVAAVGFAWICFAYTTFGLTVLHGSQEEPFDNLSTQTPVGAVEYLIENSPQGQVFNTYEWGDYLLWTGPKDIRVFVASHAHLVPREVWRAYLHVVNVGDGWEATLDRYSVNTIVIDFRYRKTLIERLRENDDWQVDYEDNRAVVFTRRQKI